MKRSNLLWGLTFIAAAVLILLNYLIPDFNVGVFKMIATVFLASIIIKNLNPIRFSGILFPAAFILILFDKELGIEELTPVGVLLIVLFLTIGLNLLFGDRIRYEKVKYTNKKNPMMESTDSSEVKAEVNFGSSIKYVNSDSFRHANYEVSFGSLASYFDNAVLDMNGADIYVDVSFGSVELFVPKNWNVKIKSNAAFGGVIEKNKNESLIDRSMPEVRINAKVAFGGVDIHYI